MPWLLQLNTVAHSWAILFFRLSGFLVTLPGSRLKNQKIKPRTDMLISYHVSTVCGLAHNTILSGWLHRTSKHCALKRAWPKKYIVISYCGSHAPEVQAWLAQECITWQLWWSHFQRLIIEISDRGITVDEFRCRCLIHGLHLMKLSWKMSCLQFTKLWSKEQRQIGYPFTPKLKKYICPTFQEKCVSEVYSESW